MFNLHKLVAISATLGILAFNSSGGTAGTDPSCFDS